MFSLIYYIIHWGKKRYNIERVNIMKNEVQTHMFSNRDLRKLLIPLALDQLLNSFMGTVDTLMVSNLGSSAISAVSLVDSINVLIIQAFFALAAGGTVICSQYMGCGDRKNATRSAKQLVFITLFLSLIVSAVCLVGNEAILRLIFGQVEESVMVNARQYFYITAISFPFIALYDDGASIFRSQENSRFPMTVSLLANVINIGLNYFFVWVVHFGVAGAAIATLISRAFSMITVLVALRNPNWKISLTHYFRIRPDWAQIKKILYVGIPSGIENSMFQFGKLAIQSSVSLMGTAAIAAQGMTNIIESLNGIMAIGVGIGLMTIVGECIGAGRKDEAIYYMKKLCIIAEIVLLAGCLLFFVLVRPITYFGGMEPESAKICIFMVTCITIVKPIVWMFSFIPAYGFRAAGDVRFTMSVSVISMWLFRVTLATILARIFHMGPIAVWIGMFTDWTIRGIIFSFRFHSRKWLNHQII